MNTVAARLAAERRFYVSAAIAIAVIVLAGFSVDLRVARVTCMPHRESFMRHLIVNIPQGEIRP